MNKSKLNVAIIGLGTVGSGVLRLLNKQKNNIKNRTGIELRVVAISAKSSTKKRSVDISPFRWVASPLTIAKDPSVDVLVERIGDMDNPAGKVIREAINNGKHIVTANKSLLAKEGSIFEELARAKGVFLRYEAAVAGGPRNRQGWQAEMAAACEAALRCVWATGTGVTGEWACALS